MNSFSSRQLCAGKGGNNRDSATIIPFRQGCTMWQAEQTASP